MSALVLSLTQCVATTPARVVATHYKCNMSDMKLLSHWYLLVGLIPGVKKEGAGRSCVGIENHETGALVK